MRVVCTAGHVDHGKSTLVRALTGMEPDRFAEEQRRGLTIDLGFAWTDLSTPSGMRTIAFVDLPGHERFIANMLAGAGPLQAALFVVAADEGWKPQSQEHLDILDLLDVRSGVVAVTKADAVDSQRLAETTADIERQLASRSLRNAPIVTVSATTGVGLDDVRDALISELELDPARTSRLPRLWVDRSFTIKGAGTVVTGTLTGGALRNGDEVLVSPTGRRARIRGMQSLKATVDSADAGDRVALNLVGLERDEVVRGNVVTVPGAAAPATVIDAWLRVLPGERLTRRGAWHVHAGSGEWLTTVRPLAGSAIEGSGPARLELAAAAPVCIGDRFVLRDAGRRATVAGGTILDADPPAINGAAARSARVDHLSQRHEALAGDDTTAVVSLYVKDRQAVPSADVGAALGLPAAAAASAAGAARLLTVGATWVDPAAGRRWAGAIAEGLRQFHATHPVDRSAPRDVALRAATDAGCPPALAPELLATLVRLGRVVAEGTGVRQPDHGVRLDPAQQRAKDDLLARLRKTPLSPPALSEAARAAGADTALIRELEAGGELIRLTADIVVTADAWETAVDRVRALYAEQGPFTAADAKNAWNTTRKYAVPLLELLDRRGITRRTGDTRDIR